VDPRANFYFYFPDEPAAQKAAARIREQGFDVEVRPGADDVNWLTLARKELSDEQLEEIDELFEELASETRGEYDGYDRP
jgi:hypothetical protein